MPLQQHSPCENLDSLNLSPIFPHERPLTFYCILRCSDMLLFCATRFNDNIFLNGRKLDFCCALYHCLVVKRFLSNIICENNCPSRLKQRNMKTPIYQLTSMMC